MAGYNRVRIPEQPEEKPQVFFLIKTGLVQAVLIEELLEGLGTCFRIGADRRQNALYDFTEASLSTMLAVA